MGGVVENEKYEICNLISPSSFTSSFFFFAFFFLACCGFEKGGMNDCFFE